MTLLSLTNVDLANRTRTAICCNPPPLYIPLYPREHPADCKTRCLKLFVIFSNV